MFVPADPPFRLDMVRDALDVDPRQVAFLEPEAPAHRALVGVEVLVLLRLVFSRRDHLGVEHLAVVDLAQAVEQAIGFIG
ncbi:hypothetical protein D3C81_1839420 [compost metagenome]